MAPHSALRLSAISFGTCGPATPRRGYWGNWEFFCSAPQDFVVLGVFCARFPPREASMFCCIFVSVSLSAKKRKSPKSKSPHFLPRIPNLIPKSEIQNRNHIANRANRKTPETETNPPTTTIYLKTRQKLRAAAFASALARMAI